MLPVLLCALAVAAAPAPKLSLAAPGLTLTNLKANLGDPLNEHLALGLSGHGFRTITSADIRTVLGLERQRQLLGCADERSTSCIAELAGAMGVDGIVQGAVTRLGKRVQVTVKIISGLDGSTLAAASESTVEDELFDAVAMVADRLGASLNAWVDAQRAKAAAQPEAPPAFQSAQLVATAEPPRASLARWWWAPALLGVGLGVGSGLAFGRAATLSEQLRTGSALITDATAAKHEGEAMATAGWVLAGTATAAGLTALAFGLFGGTAPDPVRVSGWLAPGAGGLTFAGELP